MLKDITVLLSAIGSPSSPGFLNWLHSNGERKIRVVGMDMAEEPSCKYLADSFYRVPPVTDPHYCDLVLDICKKEKVDVYLPGISEEVSAVSRRRTEFEALGTIVSISDPKVVDIANNKLTAYKFLKKKGISIILFKDMKIGEYLRNIYIIRIIMAFVI